MEIKDYVAIAAGLAVTIALFLGMWALSLRFRKPVLKRVGARASIVCLLVVIGTGFNRYVLNEPTPDFVTDSPGPPHGVASELREVRFPVTDANARQIVEVTMRALERAQGTLSLSCRIVDPGGKQLAVAEQKVEPGEGRSWQPLRFAFAAEFVGDHKLFVDIPQGVETIHVVVKEVGR